MGKARLSWQGIGIGSNPLQKESPLSLHLQAYLEEAAESADEHVIIIADEMQVQNYQTLHDISFSKARKIAAKRGKNKQKNLERILRAKGIRNVKVLCFNEVYGESQRAVTQAIYNLFNQNSEVRSAVLGCIPKGILQRAKNVDEAAGYALTEIGLILSLPGAKFGHGHERRYDEVALMINEKYGIGNKPEFIYSQKGLEFVADKNTHVEPYSQIPSNNRLLLTDSEKQFESKVDSLEGKQAKKVAAQLRQDGMVEGESLSEFYNREVKPSRKALTAPRRRLTGIAASIAAGILAIASGIGYVNSDANSIRQNHIEELSPFAFNGDIPTFKIAMNSAIEKTNHDIAGKYHINNYFRSVE